MARVVLVGNLVQLTGGAANFDLAATSVKHLFELLAERHPALAPHLAEGVAVAIDGQIYQDTLHEPIAPDSEVFVLPQIAGGSSEARAGSPRRALGARRRGAVRGGATLVRGGGSVGLDRQRWVLRPLPHGSVVQRQVVVAELVQ